MMLWIDPEHSKRPNKQRAELLKILDDNRIVVMYLADDEAQTLPFSAICGFELNPDITIKCRYTGFQRTNR